MFRIVFNEPTYLRHHLGFCVCSCLSPIISRPIVLLGHSLGGQLIKQALINAHNNPKYTPIKNATTGLVFFATPHRGGDRMLVNLGGIVAKIASCWISER